jgi:hypothetical protein
MAAPQRQKEVGQVRRRAERHGKNGQRPQRSVSSKTKAAKIDFKAKPAEHTESQTLDRVVEPRST